jgi:hypothetical protein
MKGPKVEITCLEGLLRIVNYRKSQRDFLKQFVLQIFKTVKITEIDVSIPEDYKNSTTKRLWILNLNLNCVKILKSIL